MRMDSNFRSDNAIQPCYGIVRDLQNQTVILPIIAKRIDSKVVLCGIAEDGTLIEPEDARDLSKKLGISTWLQGKTLTPLKKRPNLWQRGLISAVSSNEVRGVLPTALAPLPNFAKGWQGGPTHLCAHHE